MVVTPTLPLTASIILACHRLGGVYLLVPGIYIFNIILNQSSKYARAHTPDFRDIDSRFAAPNMCLFKIICNS